MPRNFFSPRPSVRENAVNLLILCAMLTIAFGCVCRDFGDNDNGGNARPAANTNEPANSAAANNRTGGKGKSTKANTQATTTRRSTEPDNGDFQVEYVDVENQKYEKLNQELRREKVLESAARDLNKALALPHDITLVTKDCGQINAYYYPKDHSITVCYELMDYYYQLFRKNGDSEQEANQNMADALQFIFLHELGHGLIDAYQIPVTGNEEDAADKLSSYINLKELGESGSRAAIAAADAFQMQAKMTGDKDLPFYDEHSLDQQRFYNIICQLYGSNPNKYEVLVSKGHLPEQRAVRCSDEYQKNVRAWDSLLQKYRKQ